MSTFGSFWLGPLSPYEKASLLSFAEFGHSVVLFSYKPFDGLPSGIVQGDANEIVDESYIDRFITDGRRNVAQFSDYFRYKMFLKKQMCWIDSDVMMLKSFEVESSENFLIAENGTNICNAILNLNPSSRELGRIVAASESVLDQDVPFGTLQAFNSRTFKNRVHRSSLQACSCRFTTMSSTSSSCRSIEMNAKSFAGTHSRYISTTTSGTRWVTTRSFFRRKAPICTTC